MDHPEYETKYSRHRVNAFWGTMRMTIGSDAVEEHIDKVYTAVEGWHWHFRKLYDFEDDIGDSQPEDAYDPGTALDDSFIFEADNPKLYSTWAHEVMFRPQEYMCPLRGRAFGFTNNGRMALLQSDAREGDHICLFYGIQLPFVLRNVKFGSYQVVGPCYVHQHFNWDMFESHHFWEKIPYIYLE